MNLYIKSKAVVDKRTKNLVRRIKPGEIGIICHRDLDEVGAMSLIEARVKAVVNAERSISGRYQTLARHCFTGRAYRLSIMGRKSLKL